MQYIVCWVSNNYNYNLARFAPDVLFYDLSEPGDLESICLCVCFRFALENFSTCFFGCCEVNSLRSVFHLPYSLPSHLVQCLINIHKTTTTVSAISYG